MPPISDLEMSENAVCPFKKPKSKKSYHRRRRARLKLKRTMNFIASNMKLCTAERVLETEEKDNTGQDNVIDDLLAENLNVLSLSQLTLNVGKQSSAKDIIKKTAPKRKKKRSRKHKALDVKFRDEESIHTSEVKIETRSKKTKDNSSNDLQSIELNDVNSEEETIAINPKKQRLKHKKWDNKLKQFGKGVRKLKRKLAQQKQDKNRLKKNMKNVLRSFNTLSVTTDT